GRLAPPLGQPDHGHGQRDQRTARHARRRPFAGSALQSGDPRLFRRLRAPARRPGRTTRAGAARRGGPGGHRHSPCRRRVGRRRSPSAPPGHLRAHRRRPAIPDDFGDFVHQSAAPVEPPVRVLRVEEDPVAIGTPRADVASGADEAPRPPLVTPERTDGGRRAPIRARAVINATGTWTRPFLPTYPGAADFEGNHLHTVDYTRAEDFTGQRVAVVGGGISALGFLLELAEVARTRWYTRHEPVFQDGPFTPEEGRRAVAGVAERVQAGLPVQSVVSATGLIWTPALRDADARGVLERHEMFARIVP